MRKYLQMKPIAAVSRTREILRTYNLHAKKGYGQNFLVDTTIVSRIAQSVTGEGAVIEIGPGIGGLTEMLGQRAKHVCAYEIDDALIPVLQDVLQDYTNIEVIHQDFLTVDTNKVVQDLVRQYGSVEVCANLPYYITSPVLFQLFETNPSIPRIVVMVQKEMAQRFYAPVGSKEYSSLSVECQYLYDVKPVLTAHKKAFEPMPNVDSVVVLFQRKQQDSLEDINAFFAFVKACFHQRRKTLYNNLKDSEYNIDMESMLQHVSFSASIRPQEISVAEYVKIYQEFVK